MVRWWSVIAAGWFQLPGSGELLDRGLAYAGHIRDISENLSTYVVLILWKSDVGLITTFQTRPRHYELADWERVRELNTKAYNELELNTTYSTHDMNGQHQCPVHAKTSPRNQVTGSALPKVLPCTVR